MKTAAEALFRIDELSRENRQKRYEDFLSRLDELNTEELYEVFKIACEIEELQKTIFGVPVEDLKKLYGTIKINLENL